MKIKILSAAILAALSSHAIAASKIESVEFIGMSAPATVQEKTNAYTGAKIKYTYKDGKTNTYDLVFHQLMATGEQVKGKVVGGLIDSKDRSLDDKDGQMASDAPDGTSLMKIKGMSSTSPRVSNALALVNNFEYKEIAPNDGVSTGSFWSKVPGLISLAKIDQNTKTGTLSVTDYDPISFKGVNGGWIHCGSTLSAWNTHISSEEYEPDAKVREGVQPKTADSDDATDINSFSKYYFGVETAANPYHYGLVPEVTVYGNGKTKVVKHYATGRFAREMQETAFDNRTAISGDDGKATGLFMFIADKAKNLSLGSIYAAKITQTNAENGGSYDVKWIKLGHASDTEIKGFVDKGIKFSDMFEVSNTDPSDSTFKKLLTYNGTEWLKLKTTNRLEMTASDIAKAAAFLETRRYAALLGATTEFTKMEYIAYNNEDKKFYLTISRIEATMTDTLGDIQVTRNDGGMVLEMQTANKQNDTNGKAINSNYVGTKLVAIPQLIGGWQSARDAEGNQCVQDKICGPDNLRYVSSIRTLFIGEDTSRRNNNYVWAFNVDTKKLSRILSVPMAAEATGLSIYPDYNGFAYITSNFQHPGEENISRYLGADKAAVLAALNEKWNNRKKSAIGYIGLKDSALPKFK